MTSSLMSEVRIETNINSYAATTDGNGCTGMIYWKAGDISFPDGYWNDFTLVLAGWWLESLRQMESSSTSVVFRFMDGPFFVECDRTGTSVHGRFVDDRNGRKVVAEWTAPLWVISQQIVAFATAVIIYCDKNKIGGTDLGVIKMQLNIL